MAPTKERSKEKRAEAAATKPGLRERRNLATRRAIVRAAAELTLEEDFAAATIPRIAERAEVSPRTVSGWFPAKDEILLGDAGAHIEIAGHHFRSRRGGDTIDRLRAWIEEEAERRESDELLDADPELKRLKLRAVEHDHELRARSQEAFGAIEDLIATSVARDVGGKASDPGPRLLAGAAIAMLRLLQHSALEKVKADELGERLEQGFDFLQAGLATLQH
jgi:AcrR family transcriptional regulator